MDAHVFRIIGQDLLALLQGARVEKIHGPFPGVFVFLLFMQGVKRRLVVKAERQSPQIFFTDLPFLNPARPRGDIMRLRKYVGGKKLGAGQMQFCQRRLLFPILQEPSASQSYLLIDMRLGVTIEHEIPVDFLHPVVWPEASEIAPLVTSNIQKLLTTKLWTDFPVLTPFLRESLKHMDSLDAQALLIDLEAGGGELFFYGQNENSISSYHAWPLPKKILDKKKLREIRVTRAKREGDSFLDSHIFATSQVDSALFFTALSASAAKAVETPEKREQKKRQKLLAKLNQEEQRLYKLLRLRENAKLLQDNLWRFHPEYRTETVFIPSPGIEGEKYDCGTVILLDKRLTVKENMQLMFRQSARGARGLGHVAKRRQTMEGNLPFFKEEALESSSTGRILDYEKRIPEPPGKLQEKSFDAEKDIAKFVSSEGLILLRGKNARGNARLLKLTQPHDVWLHTKDGPSAHVVIRRDHAAETISEKTLQEAALLVAEKSWQKSDSRAEIMTAYVRHVRTIKGAALGAVHVDKVESVFFVSLDQ